MPSVQRFVDQRQQAQPDSRCQALAHLHKVPVPITKLQHTERRQLAPNHSNSFVSSFPSSKQVTHQSGDRLAQTSNDHGNGFDTDAEDFDDTTFTSAGYDIKDQQGNEDGISRGSRSPLRATTESRQYEQNIMQPAADDLAVDGDEGSYEESEEGDSDDEEGEDDDHYEKSIHPDVMQELNSLGYAQFRQESMSFSKDVAFEPDVESPSSRNFRSVVTATTKGRIQSPRAADASQPRGHNIGGESDNSHSVAQCQDRRRPAPEGKHTLSQIPQQQSRGPVKHPVQPLPLWGTVSIKQTMAQQQPTPLLQPPLSKLQSHDRQAEAKFNDGIANENILVVGENIMMSPRIYPINTSKTANLQKRLEAGMRSNINPKAMSVSNEIAGHGDGELSIGEEHGLGETFEEEGSVANEERGKTRKRSRSIDYSVGELAGMSFSRLSAEPFHLDPQVQKGVLLPQPAGGTLMEKLDYLVNLKDQVVKVSQERSFLASLPMDEYEECGDIMVERFSGFVKTFKTARQQRRKIAKEFEDEIAKREERVRDKINAFEKDLNRLKSGGEDVVRKKLAL